VVSFNLSFVAKPLKFRQWIPSSLGDGIAFIPYISPNSVHDSNVVLDSSSHSD